MTRHLTPLLGLRITPCMFSDLAHCWCCLAIQIPGYVEHLTKSFYHYLHVPNLSRTCWLNQTKLVMHIANQNSLHGPAFLKVILLQLKARLPLYAIEQCHRSWMQDVIAQYAFASRNLEKDKTSKVCSNPPFQAELPYKSNIGLAWVLLVFFLVKLQNNCQCLHVLRYSVLSCREPKK